MTDRQPVERHHRITNNNAMEVHVGKRLRLRRLEDLREHVPGALALEVHEHVGAVVAAVGLEAAGLGAVAEEQYEACG